MEREFSPKDIAAFRKSFFDEGIIDQNQFEMLEGLANAEEPNYVEHVMKLFIKDSEKQIACLEQLMHNPRPDYDEVAYILYKLKTSSASTGTVKIKKEVVKTKLCLEQGNIGGAKAAFEELKITHTDVKSKLEIYFQMLKEAKATGEKTIVPSKF